MCVYIHTHKIRTREHNPSAGKVTISLDRPGQKWEWGLLTGHLVKGPHCPAPSHISSEVSWTWAQAEWRSLQVEESVCQGQGGEVGHMGSGLPYMSLSEPRAAVCKAQGCLFLHLNFPAPGLTLTASIVSERSESRQQPQPGRICAKEILWWL